MSHTFAHNLVALRTIVRREVMRIVRIWSQTLIPPAITSTLYFIIFGTVIGSHLHKIHGFDYMTYIVPGLVMMSVITNSYGNITSSFFGAKFQRFVEEMLVSPMPSWVILSGYIIGAMVRGLALGVIVMLISLLFTHLHIEHPLITLTTAMLTSMVFALAGFVNAVFAKKFDDIAIIPSFVLQPLIYLGGVFYSIDQLGEPWHTISKANPILYMVNAFRYGLLGVSDIHIGVAYAVMVFFAVVLGGFGLFLLHRGIGMRS
ncbi:MULTISPECIES: ABC transporter permease [Oleiagrimonas]|uniref:Transport permease protein n=1 Tax=Oleiagrimonas citrea TaxID=1665687 RepID=A0A846ZME0_9GAMM|nr:MULTISPECIES: ABC transporter permease [Oleiagrimonas]NKZ38621.1 ABC transporter permease [Oleiagrimonas citrea]RAP58142.1 ABC transporter permease [Oleiagrimonas sp. MCCC 1A03011]